MLQENNIVWGFHMTFDLVMKRGVYNYRGWPGEGHTHTHIMYLVVVTVVGLIGTPCDTASSQCGLQDPLTAWKREGEKVFYTYCIE